ncbi:2-hydroxyacyl-CoA dehydratase, partial [Chloroflexota bacterium]
YDEVKERVDNHVSGINSDEKYRLMFSEIPPWHSLAIFDRLAERGWNFVIESWGYHPPVPIDLTGINDPLERLAKFCFQFSTGYYEGAFKEGETYGYHAYPHLVFARDWKIDGAFFHPIVTCRSASTQLPYTRDMLMRKASIPSLMIEGDIVDLRLFDSADALRKAEPFEETMEHYREERKKRGFDW